MKNIFTVILFLSFTIGFGQKKPAVKKETLALQPVVLKPSSINDSEAKTSVSSVSKSGETVEYSQIFTSVAVQAQPPGGMNTYRKYIMSSFKLPEVDQTTNCNVVAKFVVWDDGSIRDVQIIKEEPRGLGLGKEYVRLLIASEKWTPGIVNGKSVKQYYTMPIVIQIQGSGDDSKLIEEIKKEELPVADSNTTLIEKQAEPIGGIKKFYNDLSSRIQVPEVDVTGVYKAKVKFIVNQDGSLSDFQVLEETPSSVGLGQNVITYLKSIENWIPSEQNGRKVRTYFVLPVALNIEPEIESDIKKKD